MPQMTIQEIIQAAAPRQAPGIPLQAVMQSIQQEAQSPGAVFKQYGNTVFVAHPAQQEGLYIFRALNADSPQNYMSGTLKFFSAMQNDYNATMLITQFTDPAIINIAKGISRIVKDSDMEYVVQQLPDNKYQMIIKLGEGL